MTTPAGVCDVELITRIQNPDGAADREWFDRHVDPMTAVYRRPLRCSVRRPVAALSPHESVEVETKGGQRDRR